MTKAECRRVMKARLAALSPEQMGKKSEAACRHMLLSPEFQNAHAVMLYLSMPGETNPQSLTAAALEAQKIILLPVVDWHNASMTAVKVHNLDVRYDPQAPLLPQPVAGEAFPLEEIDLIIVPGLAFSESGHRLGRGKGYYDRFLSQRGLDASLAAIAFCEQLCNDLPVESHDIGMQMIVTDQGILRIKP